MADKIATFRFEASNNDGYKKAQEKLRYEFDESGWDTDSDSGFWDTAEYYFIIIMSNIDDAGKAGDICRAYGGKPY